MEDKDLTVQEYFDKVKEAKNTMTDDKLRKLADNSCKLLRKFLITNQTEAARRVYVNLQTFEKERELLKLGIDKFIYKDYLDNYIENIASRAVKVTHLENYTRIIPDEIIDKIAKTKELFTDYFVVFTDYTGKEERKIATEERNKDPILLGAFIQKDDKHNIDFVERMYYIGDWEDEFCDLTLDKLVAEYQETEEINPVSDLEIPTTEEELIKFMQEQLRHGTEESS